MSTLSRYWHTIRYLRPVQIFNRVLRKLPRLKPAIRGGPSLNPVMNSWVEPAASEPSLVGRGEFLFLGERGSLKELGWEGAERGRLWRYNQHYFDDLRARDFMSRNEWHRHAVEDWLRHNSPFRGTGWEPYPLSRRIVNWIKWSLSGHQFRDAWKRSLFLQAAWLYKTIEWHLLANHLLANARALIFAGMYFEGSLPRKWLKKGLAIMANELGEQVLSDGGHVERSPMYHAIVLEDLLDVINISRAYGISEVPVDGWCRTAVNMLYWLRAMVHPDGQIAFFNDASFGIAPTLDQLCDYADRLNIKFESTGLSRLLEEPDTDVECVHLSESGYIRLAAGKAAALLDVAPVGLDYQPGHAHADTLSFELSIGGRRVLVNGGTSCYGSGRQRLLERQTACHNTVEIGGESSSDVWSGFRVGRRARPIGLELLRKDGGVMVSCSHTGYRWLRGKHVRNWYFKPGILSVKDTLTGNCPALARFRFHPHCTVRKEESGTLRIDIPDLSEPVIMEVQGSPWRLVEGLYAQEFGVLLHTIILEVSFSPQDVRIPGKTVQETSLIVRWQNE